MEIIPMTDDQKKMLALDHASKLDNYGDVEKLLQNANIILKFLNE